MTCNTLTFICHKHAGQGHSKKFHWKLINSGIVPRTKSIIFALLYIFPSLWLFSRLTNTIWWYKFNISTLFYGPFASHWRTHVEWTWYKYRLLDASCVSVIESVKYSKRISMTPGYLTAHNNMAEYKLWVITYKVCCTWRPFPSGADAEVLKIAAHCY